jgi:hypothetical protein
MRKGVVARSSNDRRIEARLMLAVRRVETLPAWQASTNVANHTQPLRFSTERRLTVLTGLRAANLTDPDEDVLFLDGGAGA